jgi:hypothetical protein
MRLRQPFQLHDAAPLEMGFELATLVKCFAIPNNSLAIHATGG